MPQLVPFLDLIRRVRAGDEDAARELVRQFEPAVRRAVRFRILDPRLRRLVDSQDVCQSVLGSFFVRAALGQFDLDTPGHLVRLLTAMARNKLAKQVNHLQAGCRDIRRDAGGGGQDQAVAPAADPSKQVAARELLQETRRRLSADELEILELRGQGLDWPAVAERLGGTAGALRKKLARAVGRVAEQLGLDR